MNLEQLTQANACKPGKDWFTSNFPANEAKDADVITKLIEQDESSYLRWVFNYLILDNPQACQAAVIATGDVRYIYYFARDVNGADLQACQAAVIATGDVWYIYYFARDVNGADLQACQAAVIATGNAQYIYYFACNVNGADTDLCKEALSKLNAPTNQTE